MVAKKLLLDDKITPCVKQICLLGVTCKVLNTKTWSGEIFFFWKTFAANILICASTKLLFFLPPADWPTTNFLGMYCYFPVIRLVNFVVLVTAVGL